MTEVIHLYTTTRLSCRKLAATFNRLYATSHHMTVSRMFVYETLKAYHAEMTQAQQHFRNRLPPPMPKNRVWGLDFTGKQDAAGQMHYLMGVIDHGTRHALLLHPLPDKSVVTGLATVAHAIKDYGKPDAIRTDNEPLFHSAAFREGLAKLGIRHQFTELHKPWQNGRIERLFGTLKSKLDLITVDNGDDLGQALVEFRFWYNQVRPHQHLNGLTPEEAWQGLDPWQTPYKRALPFTQWDGLLTGYYLIR